MFQSRDILWRPAVSTTRPLVGAPALLAASTNLVVGLLGWTKRKICWAASSKTIGTWLVGGLIPSEKYQLE